MKLLIFFTLVFTLQVSAKSFGQKVTLSANNSPLEKLFKEVKKQTGYTFVYTREQLKNSLPVTIKVTNTPLTNFLSLCFQNQPLSFIIEDNYVVVQSKTATEKLVVTADSLIDIKGKVFNENGEPLIGATVLATQTNKVALTNAQGEFSLPQINQNDIISISNVGYVSEKLNVNNQRYYLIKLKFAINSLEETIVKGYYSTSKKLNTGSVVKVSGAQITNQPITNPILGLEGLVPGLLITQSNGLPGSRFTALIRGQNSIQNGNSPLFIIDGVPFLSDRDALTQLNGMLANSPFNSLDPNNIESIEVLKDADATAIYGSRGANGVILITTKKINTERNSLSLNLSRGWGKVTRTMELMNTQEYLEMRKEAFANDGVTPTLANAPDLLAWDQNRYTDWKKLFIGGIAKTYNAQLRYSGGNQFTSFSFGAGSSKETTVFPGDFSDVKSNVDFSLHQIGKNNKLSFDFITSYGNDLSQLPAQDLTLFTKLPPNSYPLIDNSGKLIWREAGYSVGNPLAIIYQKNNVTTNRLTANSIVTYKPIPDLQIKINFGYNKVSLTESILSPIKSQDPAYEPTGSIILGDNFIRTWIIEPQVIYNLRLSSKLKFESLIGTTFQNSQSENKLLIGDGYESDELLNSLASAPYISATNSKSEYKYAAVFSRIALNFNKKYILNFTGRRDASSRFGKNNQFANFGALGSAWIFTEEKFIKNAFPFLSFGKIRASYGTTGNDQIGNYQYLDTYRSTTFPYQNQPGLYPARLFNDNYGWEKNKKLEIAIELGLLKDRLTINLSLYKNLSDNQIIRYSLPTQAGFTDVLMNFPGVVQNKGYEFSMNAIIVKENKFEWNLSFNISNNQNKLISFPGLSNSSYAATYIINKPLNAIRGLGFLGVDKQTGIYNFEDINKDGKIDNSDYEYLGTANPKYYGGLSNSLSYRNLQLNFLLEFRNQSGRNAIYSYSGLIGTLQNQPKYVLNRWIDPGDSSPFQKYSQSYIGNASVAAGNISRSGAALSNASYLRVKNIVIAYTIPDSWLKKFKLNNSNVFCQMQNFFTLTKYKGNDPESQTIAALPILKTVTAGIKINL